MLLQLTKANRGYSERQQAGGSLSRRFEETVRSTSLPAAISRQMRDTKNLEIAVQSTLVE